MECGPCLEHQGRADWKWKVRLGKVALQGGAADLLAAALLAGPGAASACPFHLRLASAPNWRWLSAVAVVGRFD